MKRILTKIVFFAAVLSGAAACEDNDSIQTETPAPRLISIVPRTGYSGCTAIISGEYFSDNPQENVVIMDGNEIPVTYASHNRLTLTMPEHELGKVEIQVSVNGKDAPAPLQFTYSELPEIIMTVSSVQPSAGYAGDRVLISGDNFSTVPDGNKVTFGGVKAEIISATQNSLEVIAPEHGRGKAEVTVEAIGQTSSVWFTYMELMIDSNSPDTGAEGVEVTIKGEGFSTIASENNVTANGIPASVSKASANELTVIMPDNPEGTYPFVITVGGRTVTGGSFTYSGCWRVETVLGAASGVTGNVEGTGKDARLWYAQDIVLKGNGSYLMTLRQKDHGIYMVTGDYTFTKLVNQNDNAGLLNSSFPWGCALDSRETLYLAAKGGGKLLEYTADGTLSNYTVEGLTITGMNPMDVVIDREDNIYLLLRGNSSSGNGKVVRIKDRKLTATYDLTGMKLYESLLLSDDGKKIFLFGNDTGNIRMIDLETGQNTVIAGTGTRHNNASNYTDGTPGNPLSATFNIIEGAVFTPDGTILFGDSIAATVRQFKPGTGGDYTKGTVTTIAGKAYEKSAQADGQSTGARFTYPNGMCFAPDGKTIYMIDGTGSATLRKIYYR